MGRLSSPLHQRGSPMIWEEEQTRLGYQGTWDVSEPARERRTSHRGTGGSMLPRALLLTCKGDEQAGSPRFNKLPSLQADKT